jgi:hypothetical protein
MGDCVGVAAGCWGVWDWKGEFEAGPAKGCVVCGDERAKGLVD